MSQSKSDGIEVPCHDCKKAVLLPQDGTAFYWTAKGGYEPRPIYCAECAIVAEAPMVKPQPKQDHIPKELRGWM